MRLRSVTIMNLHVDHLYQIVKKLVFAIDISRSQSSNGQAGSYHTLVLDFSLNNVDDTLLSNLISLDLHFF